MSVGNALQQFKLGDIKGGGYDEGEEAWGEVTLMVLATNGLADNDENTGRKKIYQWKNNEESPAGWYDEDGETMWDDNTLFDAGQGFYAQGYGYTLQSAGEVNTAPVSVATDQIGGNTLIGNPYPCQITLADISGGGYGEDEEAWGEVTIMVLGTNGLAETDPNTGLKKIYQWKDNEESSAGWYDEEGETLWDDATPFPAGQAFYTQGYGYTVDFTFPKATED